MQAIRDRCDMRIFFPQIGIPTRKDVEYEIQKIYPDCRILTFKVSEFVPGQPLSQRQMAVMQQSINSGNSYPPEVMAQYNKQKSST